ncbi:MAG: oligoendopeptidase F [Ignavibacteriales bacterium]|nr:oligoendopeptidase F [Ignavibacteriales bacterium]
MTPDVRRFTDTFHAPETAASGELPERSEIDEARRWNPADVFESDEAWRETFERTSARVGDYAKFKGTLGESAENLMACLRLDEEVGAALERLYLYAMLQKDSDLRVSRHQAAHDEISTLASRATEESAFIRPELLALDERKLADMRRREEFATYGHFFDDLLRAKPHTLPPEQERLLAMSSEATSAASRAFSLLNNADLEFPSVETPEGEKTTMSHGRFYAAMRSKDRDFRRRAYEAYYQPYRKFSNTFYALLNGAVKTHVFHARARNYGSAREAALDANNIPLAVYDNLVNAANDNLEPLRRWAEIKRRALGVEELRPYDAYVGLFDAETKRYTYEEGMALTLDALEPLGEEYLANVRRAFENRWIDVYETKGKRSGAYSSGGAYGTHPYVLLNWNGLLDDVFTLAHEIGHNMHSWMTVNAQPYIYSDYAIFVAEVASTFNESLLLDYLVERAETDAERLSLRERYLDNVASTFYRQTMFAEFERTIHERVEKGTPLSADSLREEFKRLYARYWGPAMRTPEEEEFTWARIPHFYYNFYVYQYATGFAASEALALRVKTEGAPAVERYLEFLRSGGSDYPINLLKKAGVDMTTTAPIEATLKKTAETIDEVERLS